MDRIEVDMDAVDAELDNRRQRITDLEDIVSLQGGRIDQLTQAIRRLYVAVHFDMDTDHAMRWIREVVDTEEWERDYPRPDADGGL